MRAEYVLRLEPVEYLPVAGELRLRYKLIEMRTTRQ